MTSTAHELHIQSISASYGHRVALRDIEATLPGGTVTGLIGPNGSGKSTLINVIAGGVEPDQGQILFDDAPLNRRKTPIAYVPQARTVNWDFPLSAADLVMMGRYREIGWLRRRGGIDRERVSAALSALGLEGTEDRHISQFSGGQQQRLFLARALAQDPEIVLFDEPMTGVDIHTRSTINRMIRQFADTGAIVLVATHDLDEVQAVCDAVLCLNCEMIAFGPTSEVFTPETLRRTFGGQIAIFN